MHNVVRVGFVEKVSDPDQLTSLFFLSIVGGGPAWLDIRDLPAQDSLACGVCSKPPVTSLIPLSALRRHNTPNCSSYCKDRSRHDSVISFHSHKHMLVEGVGSEKGEHLHTCM